MIHVFTSAAVNYIPKVRLLCQSIKKFHPDWQIHFLLADEKPEWLNTKNEPFDHIVTIDMLNIPSLRSWMFFHNIVELSTAIKPFALQYLLERNDCDGVLYLDPDIVIFSPLSDLLEHLEQSNLLLTPHLLLAESTLDAIMDNEICSLRHGIFNLGFLAVKPSLEGKKFAKWWSDRLYHFCVSDWKQGLWTDQRWIDFAPVFFNDVHILRSPRYNVAPWNLSKRIVSGNFDDGFYVNNEPLGFYHFTGFDSGAHLLMTKKYAPNNDAIEALTKWYLNQVLEGNKQFESRCEWGLKKFNNGEIIAPLHRKIYRDRPDLQAAFPDPYESLNGNTYYDWLMFQGKIEFPELYNITI